MTPGNPAPTTPQPAAPVNYGAATPAATKPVKVEAVASFDDPWPIALLRGQMN